jgi:6-phosphogluconolactonase
VSISRRDFMLAAAALAGCRPGAGGARSRRRDRLVHVGTYTQGSGRNGLHHLIMDGDTGMLRPVASFDVGPDPSYVALHPSRPVLYAVNEIGNYEGRASGALAAFTIGANGEISALGARHATGGAAPCYVSLDRTGRFAFVANYTGGNIAVFPVADDGRLREASAVVPHQGTGPRPQQRQPHAHCIIADPTNRYVFAADLGADRVFVYRFDERTGTLTLSDPHPAPLPPGAGPRHLVFHPNGRFLYVVNELDLTLGTFHWNADQSSLASLGTVPLLPSGASSQFSAADVHVAPSGRFVYASVRGDDSIAVFSIDDTLGTPTHVQRMSTGGRWPRNFAIDPSGRFLFVANQRSNDIFRFTIDQESGRLTATGARVEIPAPVCIRFGREV